MSKGEGELPERARLVAQAFNDGDSIPTLMERHQVKIGTILDHLLKYAQAGNPLRKGAEVEALSSAAPKQRQAVFAAFAELGATYLKPVYDKMNGTLNYDELKILRVAYIISQQEKP
ncbi:MAG: helix-turn-helix domain-containing protein [Chloroflexota bacterium]